MRRMLTTQRYFIIVIRVQRLMYQFSCLFFKPQDLYSCFNNCLGSITFSLLLHCNIHSLADESNKANFVHNQCVFIHLRYEWIFFLKEAEAVFVVVSLPQLQHLIFASWPYFPYSCSPAHLIFPLQFPAVSPSCWHLKHHNGAGTNPLTS